MRVHWLGSFLLVMIASACGGSDSGTESGLTGTGTPWITATPRPTEVLAAQAMPACTAAFNAPAPSTPGKAQQPAVLYWRRDESRVQAQSRSSTAGVEWHGELGDDLPAALRARTPDEVRAVVCRQEQYVQVGVYQESNSAAVRIDWELRVVHWPDGALLATRTFRGGDPPATRTTRGSVSWEHGEAPQAASRAWLEQLLQAGP